MARAAKKTKKQKKKPVMFYEEIKGIITLTGGLQFSLKMWSTLVSIGSFSSKIEQPLYIFNEFLISAVCEVEAGFVRMMANTKENRKRPWQNVGVLFTSTIAFSFVLYL